MVKRVSHASLKKTRLVQPTHRNVFSYIKLCPNKIVNIYKAYSLSPQNDKTHKCDEML